MEWFFVVLLIVIVVAVAYNLLSDRNASKVELHDKVSVPDEEQQRLETLEMIFGKRGAALDKQELHVWVFNKTKKMVVYESDFNDRKVFSFNDIVGCDLTSYDNVSEKTIPGQSETTYVSKTSGTSMAGRALVGAAIAGPVGAIIGGVTAKRTVVGVTNTRPDTTIKTVNTTWSAVVHVLKDGVEDRIICNGYGSNKLKTMIDEIISIRDNQIGGINE